MVALLNMGSGKVAAADLATMGQSDFIAKVLLATTGQSTSSNSKNTSSNQQDAPKTSSKTSTQDVATLPAPVLITVQEGDSLSTIAATQNSTWQRIYDANETIVNPDVINPGQQLRIPTPDEVLTSRPLSQSVVATTATTTAPAVRSAAVQTANYPVSSDDAKAFIYSHESGNNPNATNAGGCYGLGQDCNGVVRNQCGADYACQDAYFTGYAMRRYGSWEAAQAFWLAHRWW